MKKALLSLIVVSATLLYAKATEYPKLDTKITTNEQLEMAEAFLLGLDTFSNMKDIYLDDHIHYEKVINSIDAKNSNWCDLSSYENQLKVEK